MVEILRALQEEMDVFKIPSGIHGYDYPRMIFSSSNYNVLSWTTVSFDSCGLIVYTQACGQAGWNCDFTFDLGSPDFDICDVAVGIVLMFVLGDMGDETWT